MKRTFLAVSLLILFSVGISACRKSTPGWKTHAISHQEQNRNSTQVVLPRALWEKITSVLVQTGIAPLGETKAEHAAETANAAKAGPLPSVFAPLKVYLIEKNQGILTRGNTSISFASGGGELDLHDYLQPKNGSFYLVVEFLPEKEDIERHVFFLSHAAARRLNGDRYGAGCNTYFDITSSYNKAMTGDGFLVNTSEGRHVSALAGVYFFAASHEGKLYLASLTIKDSHFPALQCDRLKTD